MALALSGLDSTSNSARASTTHTQVSENLRWPHKPYHRALNLLRLTDPKYWALSKLNQALGAAWKAGLPRSDCASHSSACQ